MENFSESGGYMRHKRATERKKRECCVGMRRVGFDFFSDLNISVHVTT
jgi:hypothetical protein